jgi:heme iron utilization protein
MTDIATGAAAVKTAHQVPQDASLVDVPLPLSPLIDVPGGRRPTAAEEARTIVAAGNVGSLASLTADGDPWASVVTYGLLEDGTPVMCLSRLALHGRNLSSDQRASLAVAAAIGADDDPGDTGRVTLAGVVEQPTGGELDAARAAYEGAVPSAPTFTDFDDFTFWLLRVQRVRWVGGFGRMASCDTAGYHAAAPDPVAPGAAFAVDHLNEAHDDALLDMARTIAGHTDATAARCVRADRYGLELHVDTPRGLAMARVGFAEPANVPGDLRAATVELAKRARRP